jgi:tRNA C32,U32 (ribose-2'-O)-methylase TrmJ
MGTRQSIDHFLEQCDGALRFADFEYTEASRQEHWDDESFQNSQSYLEEVLRQMDPIYASGNREQKERLQRMKTQLDLMKHEMVTLRH